MNSCLIVLATFIANSVTTDAAVHRSPSLHRMASHGRERDHKMLHHGASNLEHERGFLEVNETPIAKARFRDYDNNRLRESPIASDEGERNPIITRRNIEAHDIDGNKKESKADRKKRKADKKKRKADKMKRKADKQKDGGQLRDLDDVKTKEDHLRQKKKKNVAYDVPDKTVSDPKAPSVEYKESLLGRLRKSLRKALPNKHEGEEMSPPPRWERVRKRRNMRYVELLPEPKNRSKEQAYQPERLNMDHEAIKIRMELGAGSVHLWRLKGAQDAETFIKGTSKAAKDLLEATDKKRAVAEEAIKKADPHKTTYKQEYMDDARNKVNDYLTSVNKFIEKQSHYIEKYLKKQLR